MEQRQILGIALVLAGIVLVFLTITTVFALFAGILTLVLGVLVLLRIGSGRPLFPAIQEHLDYRASMREAESKPGPTCWRCRRTNVPFSTVCAQCGATLTE